MSAQAASEHTPVLTPETNPEPTAEVPGPAQPDTARPRLATAGKAPALVATPAPQRPTGATPVRARHMDRFAAFSGAGGLAAVEPFVQLLSNGRYSRETLAAYRRVIAAFTKWAGCAPREATTEHVLAYLTWLAVNVDEDGEPVLGPDEVPERGLHPTSVGVALAGLKYDCQSAGVPGPVADPRVDVLMMGIRRTYGVRADRPREPLTIELLRRVLAAATLPPLQLLRPRAVALLHHTTGATAGQMARMTGRDIVVGEHAVEVHLPPTNGSTGVTITQVPRRGAGRALAAVLEPLAAARAEGPLLGDAHGAALSRQHVDRLLRRHVGRGGQPRRWQDLTADLDEQYPFAEQSLVVARDLAILTLGFFTALRRGSLSRLRRDDLVRLPDGWRVRVYMEKNRRGDKYPRYIVLPLAPGDPACPTTALDRWMTFTDAFCPPGTDRSRVPVFWSITRHGHVVVGRGGVPRALTGAAINDRVQELCVRAGLDTDAYGGRHAWGAHSLRAGFITSMRNAGEAVTVESIMDVTGHTTYASLKGYDRPTTARNAASKALLGLPVAARDGGEEPVATVTELRAVTLTDLLTPRGRVGGGSAASPG